MGPNTTSFSSRGVVLFPDVLAEKEPTEGLAEGAALRFYFEYDVMPALVMPRFMVKSGGHLDPEMCWRTGAVLKNRAFGSVAVVRQDKHRRRIYVEVKGRQARDYYGQATAPAGIGFEAIAAPAYNSFSLAIAGCQRYAPACDLNDDCKVDYLDLEIMSGEWLAGGADLAADVNTDSVVDMKDYAILADMWRE